MADQRTYQHALAQLEQLQSNQTVVSMVSNANAGGRDPNLDAMPEMLDWVKKAGYSVEDFNKLRVVHVAGTKGKGSVCAMIDSILNEYVAVQKAGQPGGLAANQMGGLAASPYPDQNEKKLGRVGLYTSPHLKSPRERIRLDGQPISQLLFAKYFFELWDAFSNSAAAQNHPDPRSAATKPAYFRYLTIMALHVFMRENVETAIIECGIGGEYDSTNILQKQAVTVSVITKLSIDHVPMLGNTLDRIAWHKAGIMKKGVHCFTPPEPEEAMTVLKRRAAEIGAWLMIVNRRSQIESGECKLKLEGDFQKDNASLAIVAAGRHLKEIGFGDVLAATSLPATMKNGLDKVQWEGRCQVKKERNVEWYIDGAHTPDSIYEAAKWFTEKWNANGRFPAMLIFNSQLRDAPQLARVLSESLDQLTGRERVFQIAAFVANTAFTRDIVKPYPDLQLQRETAEAWTQLGGSAQTTVYGSIEGAIEEARQIARARYPQPFQVLITGSLHLAGGFLKVIGGNSAEEL